MRFRSALALVVLGAGFLGAAPTDPVPFSPFPVPPPAPPLPAPAPAPPGTVLNLTSDVLYIVNSKTDAVLRAHPAGLVKVTKEAGPLRIRGKFVDGTGGVETRTYAGPCVFTVEALPNQTGRVELDLIPVGFKDEKEILTAPVDVNSGQAPQPPPIDPNPPIVPTDPFIKALQTAYRAESSPDKLKYTSVLASLYRTAATTTVLDPTVKTNGDLFADLLYASNLFDTNKTLPKSAIPGIRTVIGQRETGTDTVPGLFKLKAATLDRNAAAKELTYIADSLTAATK